MEDREKQIARTLERVISGLSDEKKQYFIGFAEGVAAMADLNRIEPENQPVSA